MSLIISQQVSWFSVHTFVAPLLDQVVSWPMVGTPAWCQLDDTDPLKLAALYDAARHWALRLETCQVADCEASKDVAAAADWSAIASRLRQHADYYAERPWLKRVAS